jgi:hypothetical protein
MAPDFLENYLLQIINFSLNVVYAWSFEYFQLSILYAKWETYVFNWKSSLIRLLNVNQMY